MTPVPASQSTHVLYPDPSEIEKCLFRIAAEVSDATPLPVRVTMMSVHGGKPPLYALVLRSRDKAPMRQKLEQVLNRKLSLGTTSFSLKADEATLLINYGGLQK
jgi:hypothetical protein